MNDVKGSRLVSNQHLLELIMLIDPPPTQVDGQMMVFRNPMAAGVLTKISAIVRAILDSEVRPGCPAVQSGEGGMNRVLYKMQKLEQQCGYVFVMHPDDPAIHGMPDGTHIVLQRNLPPTPPADPPCRPDCNHLDRCNYPACVGDAP